MVDLVDGVHLGIRLVIVIVNVTMLKPALTIVIVHLRSRAGRGDFTVPKSGFTLIAIGGLALRTIYE